HPHEADPEARAKRPGYQKDSPASAPTALDPVATRARHTYRNRSLAASLPDTGPAPDLAMPTRLSSLGRICRSGPLSRSCPKAAPWRSWSGILFRRQRNLLRKYAADSRLLGE